MKAYAKLNLALTVGPLRLDGKHEVATVLQAIDLHDDVELEPSEELMVAGFAEDTLVRAALEALAGAAGVEPLWRVRLEKRIPVAAGLAGGSSNAAAALLLANELLEEPLDTALLHALAAGIGADIPFFLESGPQLATGDGSELAPLALPGGYFVVLVLPEEERKESTADVYDRFDERLGADGFEERRTALREALLRVEVAHDLAKLPPNDLASSPLAGELERLGAFRADVTGAGPAVYGLFEREDQAEQAVSMLSHEFRALLARPVTGR